MPARPPEARRRRWRRWPMTARRSWRQTCAAARVQLLGRPSSPAASKAIRLHSGRSRGRPAVHCRSSTSCFVDAPCSGLGIVRRDPDIRWRRLESDLAPLASAQLRMIGNAAEAVRPGGRLVYSTCSSEPEENEAVVAEFLNAHQAFSPIDLRVEQPAYFRALEPVLDDERLSAHLARTSTASRPSSAPFCAV